MRNRDMGTVRSDPLRARRRLSMETEDRLPGREVRNLHIDPPDPGRAAGPERLECRLLDGEACGKILNPISAGLFQLPGVVDPPQKPIPETLDATPHARNVNKIESHTSDHDYLWLRLSIRSARRPMAAIWREVIRVIVTEASMIFSVKRAL